MGGSSEKYGYELVHSKQKINCPGGKPADFFEMFPVANNNHLTQFRSKFATYKQDY